MGVEEKRLYPRLSLKNEDGFFGQFIMAGGDKLTALIVNLSAGGVNISVPEKSRDLVKEGDLVLLKTIAGATHLSFLGDVKGEIRWIKKLADPKYFSVGIRLIDISDDARQQLSRFVDSERKARGQYS